MKIVIIGNGTAGNQAALRLRESGVDVNITIVSAEACPEYDPCSLPYYLSGQIPRSAVFKKTTLYYDHNDIELVLNSRVLAIHPDKKCIITVQGESISYDKLVLAHGGDLFVPPIEGAELKGVFSLKQLAEADGLKQHGGRRAVVIGSGAIGIETAEALKKRGFTVSVIELYEWILPTLFDRETSAILADGLRANGIRVHTGEKVVAIEGRTHATSVVTDKRTIACDTVVMATGVVPGVALAKTAGIDVERGIKVDAGMQTSVADIYACGDCVETVDVCTGEDAMFQLKHNAIDQANVAADNIIGRNVIYPGAYAFARVHFFDVHAAAFGKTSAATQCELGELEIVERTEDKGYLRLVVKNGLIVGVQAVGVCANTIGIFIRMARRGDNFNHLRENWQAVKDPASHYPWTHRLAGSALYPNTSPVPADGNSRLA